MQIEESPAFYVIGMPVRTNNTQEMAGNGKIGELWQEFIQWQIAGTIPQKAGNEILAVYSDYESDETGAYTYLLGVRVHSVNDVPPGLISQHVPAGRYAAITSEVGPVTQVVPKLWQRIWSMPAEELGGQRAFQIDYEVYGQAASNPENAQVTVFLGLKQVPTRASSIAIPQTQSTR